MGAYTRNRVLQHAVLGFVLFLFYYTLFSLIPRNADNTSIYYAGVDLARGNILLRDWVLPPDNYYTEDVFLYALLYLFFGVSGEVCYVASALIWTSIVLLSLTLTRTGLESEKDKWTSMCSVLTVLGLPPLFACPALGLIADSPLHILSIVYVLGCYILLTRYVQLCGGKWLAAYAALLTWACFGDPVVEVLGAVPVLATSMVFAWLAPAKRAQHVRVFAATVVAVVVAKATLAVVLTYGFNYLKLPLSFAAFERLAANAGILLRGLFIFAGADFFGQPLKADNLHVLVTHAVRLPIILFQIVGVGYLTIQCVRCVVAGAAAVECKKEVQESGVPPYLDTLLLASVLANVGAGLFSSAMQDLGHIRYLLPGFICGNVLLGRVWKDLALFRLYIRATTIFCLLMMAAIYSPKVGKPPVLVTDPQRALIGRLLQLNLRDGFAWYWDGTLTTVMSREQLFTRPLNGDGEKLLPYVWIAKSNWYAPESFRSGRFYVISQQSREPGSIPQEKVVSTFGEPEYLEQYGPYIINVYSVERHLRLFEEFHGFAKSKVKNPN